MSHLGKLFTCDHVVHVGVKLTEQVADGCQASCHTLQQLGVAQSSDLHPTKDAMSTYHRYYASCYLAAAALCAMQKTIYSASKIQNKVVRKRRWLN